MRREPAEIVGSGTTADCTIEFASMQDLSGSRIVIAAHIRARVAVLVAVAVFGAALLILPPQSSAASDGVADHGSGRVACDGQWYQLHKPEAGYQDFIRNCMRRTEYPPSTAPQSGGASDGVADHGPGRVACDVQWYQSHRPEADYQDFIRSCMRRPQ